VLVVPLVVVLSIAVHDDDGGEWWEWRGGGVVIAEVVTAIDERNATSGFPAEQGNPTPALSVSY
jgi:hypothetical protein